MTLIPDLQDLDEETETEEPELVGYISFKNEHRVIIGDRLSA